MLKKNTQYFLLNIISYYFITKKSNKDFFFQFRLIKVEYPKYKFMISNYYVRIITKFNNNIL